MATIRKTAINCQIDSSADRNIMRQDAYNSIIGDNSRYALKGQYITLEGSGGLIRSLGNVFLPTKIGESIFDLEYVVVPVQALPSQILLSDQILDFTDVRMRKQSPKLDPIVSDGYIKLVQAEAHQEKNNPADKAISKVPERYRAKVQHIVDNYKPVTPKESAIKMYIELKDNQPIFNRPRRLAPQELKSTNGLNAL